MRRGLLIKCCLRALAITLLLVSSGWLNDLSLNAAERVTGAVRTATGEPVLAAEVWVVEYQPADWPLVLAKTKTDERGEFAASITLPPHNEPLSDEDRPPTNLDGPDFEHPPIKARRGRLQGFDLGLFADPLPRCVQVWVRTTKDQLGWSGLFPTGPSLRTTVVMQSAGERVGVVKAADGSAVKASTIRLVGLPTGEGSGRGGGSNRYCLMPREWTESFVVRPDARGQFATPGWPTGDVMVSGSAEGFSELIVTWQTPHPRSRDDLGPWTFRLFPAEPLRGEVRGLHLGDLPKPQEMTLRMCEVVRLSDQKENTYAEGFHLATTTVRGRNFVFENAPKLPAMRYSQGITITIVSRNGSPTKLWSYFTTDQEKGELPVLIVYRRAPIRGRVVEEKTGSPIPGANLSFGMSERAIIGRMGGGVARTNALGEFETRIPIADYWVSVWSNGVNLVYPPNISKEEFHSDRWLDMDRLVARCQHRSAGVVVDASGKPVPDADVFVDLIASGPEFEPRVPTTRTDREGRFIIPVPSSHDDIWVKARLGDLVSERTQIAGSRLPGNVIKREISLTLKPAATTRIAGTMVDASGQPLGGRPVIVWREVYQEGNQPREQFTHGAVVEILRSGPDGRFQSSPLWVGEAYFVQARGTNGETVNSHKLVAVSGSHIDVGRVIVPSRQRSMSGRVVDTAGRPIAGAMVSSADATRSTTTDTDGRFQLGRWSYQGEVFFVEHSRYRPALRIVRESERSLVVRLFGREERVANSRVAVERLESPSEFGSVITPSGVLDRESVERAWQAVSLLRRLSEHGVSIDLPPIIGRLEPWSAVTSFREQSTGRGFTSPILNALVRLAEENPDRALGALLRFQPSDALEASGRLADWYSTRDPNMAALFADRYLALYDGKSGAINALLHLGWAGHWKIQRGQREEGLALLARAAKILEEAPQNHTSYGTRGEIVERYLRMHSPSLAQAVAAAKPKSPHRTAGVWDWNELRPDSARTWLDRVESEQLVVPNVGIPRVLSLQFLQQTARVDPATTRRLAGLFRSLRNHIGYRRTLVMLALWDQQSAWDVIDEDLLDFRRLDDEHAMLGAAPITRFERAARLLVAGSDVGYPDLDTLIANCVAHRERVTGPVDIALRRADSLLSGLAALALFAPDEARPLAEEFRVAVPRHLLGSGFRSPMWRTRRGVCRADWYLILALTDPAEALRLLEDEVAEYLNRPPPPKPSRVINESPDPFSGITTLADVWTTPPEQRWRFLNNHDGW